MLILPILGPGIAIQIVLLTDAPYTPSAVPSRLGSSQDITARKPAISYGAPEGLALHLIS